MQFLFPFVLLSCQYIKYNVFLLYIYGLYTVILRYLKQSNYIDVTILHNCFIILCPNVFLYQIKPHLFLKSILCNVTVMKLIMVV